jgi:hypothetical protein
MFLDDKNDIRGRIMTIMQNALSERFRLGFLMHQADPDSVEANTYSICLTNETGPRVDQQKIRLYMTETETLEQLAGRIRPWQNANDEHVFSVGDEVEARPLNCRKDIMVPTKDGSRYYTGRIVGDNEDGTYDVQYTDDTGRAVSPSIVETLPGGCSFKQLSHKMEENWENKNAGEKTSAIASFKDHSAGTRGKGASVDPKSTSSPVKFHKDFMNMLQSPRKVKFPETGLGPFVLNRVNLGSMSMTYQDGNGRPGTYTANLVKTANSNWVLPVTAGWPLKGQCSMLSPVTVRLILAPLVSTS